MFISKVKESAKNGSHIKGGYTTGYTAGMTFASEEAYHSFQNICRAHIGTIGATAIVFAVSWARQMEAELKRGKVLDPETIENCSELALDSIRSAKNLSCNWARNLLIVHWKYGELLMTDGHRKLYGNNPDMSKFYVNDDVVRIVARRVGKVAS